MGQVGKLHMHLIKRLKSSQLLHFSFTGSWSFISQFICFKNSCLHSSCHHDTSTQSCCPWVEDYIKAYS